MKVTAKEIWKMPDNEHSINVNVCGDRRIIPLDGTKTSYHKLRALGYVRISREVVATNDPEATVREDY